MAEKKRYESVAEMIRGTSSDESFHTEFGERVSQRTMVKRLLAFRAAKGLSQKDIADRVGCSQSRISKLENGTDENLRFGDLVKYATALGTRVGFTFLDRNVKPVDQIKYHAFSIKSLMDRLAELASDDHIMAQAVSAFFGEAFFNLINMIQDSASRLPRRPDEDTPYLTIELFEGDQPADVASSAASPAEEDEPAMT